LGLWETNTEIDFFVSSYAADSSFIQPKKYAETIQIPALRLDSMQLGKIKLLKLEAEGGELEV
jgi:hypothetical protein